MQTVKVTQVCAEAGHKMLMRYMYWICMEAELHSALGTFLGFGVCGSTSKISTSLSLSCPGSQSAFTPVTSAAAATCMRQDVAAPTTISHTNILRPCCNRPAAIERQGSRV